MKNIGEVIKQTRIKKKLSREKLEAKTKIKKEFIEGIENLKWEALPDYSVVSGFVKSIAGALDLDKKHLSALLRRDYPPKILKVLPKPEMKEKFKWNPRLTFIMGVVLVFLVILTYLGTSYVNFISPPKLAVYKPEEGQQVGASTLVVAGETDPEASIIVNNQPVIVEENGRFETEIEIFEGTREIIVVSKSRSGKISTLTRKIIPEPEN